MIIGFANKDTEKVWRGGSTKRWSADIQRLALRKLFLIHAAEDINDLRVPPGNRPHKLKGDLKDYWAINDQWRTIFKWKGNNADHVEIVDYH